MTSPPRLHQAFREPRRIGVVQREAGHILFERDLAGGGKHSGLPHAAAQHLAPAPCLANQLGGPAEQGADGSAEALGEAEGDGIDVPGDLLHVHVLLDRGVEDAGAVQVQAKAVLADERLRARAR